MAKRKNRTHRRRRGQDESQDDLITAVRVALRTGAPINFLSLVCDLITQLEAAAPLDGTDAAGHPTPLEAYVDAFIDVRLPETTALLAALAVLVADHATATRCRSELARRRDRVPAWLARLDEASVGSVARLADEAGDADVIVLELRLVDGGPLTFMALVDHNLDDIVKQVGVLACPADEVTASFLSPGPQQPVGTSAHDLDPVDARAIVADAIHRADDVYPPYTSATWPACRPLLELALGTMPSGGTVAPRVGWSREQLDMLVQEFLRSPELESLDDLELDEASVELVVRMVVDLAAHHGGGDPMRWSEPRVGHLLLGLLPRTTLNEPDLVDAFPGILSSFVVFCGRERGVTEELVGATVREVAVLADAFRELMVGDPFDGGPQR